MSLILDALNRSESDRDGDGQAPGLGSVHGRADHPRPLWQRLAWPGLTLLFALIAGLAWWGGGVGSDDSPEGVRSPAAPVDLAPEVAVPPLTSRPVAPDAATPEQASARLAENDGGAARPAPGFSDDVAALYSQMQAAGVNPDELVAPAPPSEQTAVPVDWSPVPSDATAQMERMARMAELSKAARATTPTRAQPRPEPARPSTRSEPANSEPAGSEPAYDVDALALAAAAALDAGPRPSDPVVQHAAPFISDLRQSQKDQIPSIFYSRHNWSSSPAERSVVLNGEQRREGQQVKPGLRLVEILETSIVLDFNGTEFQLRSLNSWVNL